MGWISHWCVNVQQIQVGSFSLEWFFLSVRHPAISPPHLLTHILYQQPDIESLPDGGSVCCEPAMNFSSPCPVNFPASPNYLLFHASFFLFILSPWSILYLPINFISPCDALVLFHYLETGRQSSTLGWNWSTCQDCRQTHRLSCVSVWMCVWTWQILNFKV